MLRLEVSAAVRHIYVSLGFKRLSDFYEYKKLPVFRFTVRLDITPHSAMNKRWRRTGDCVCVCMYVYVCADPSGHSSKAWVCGRSPAGIVGSDPAGGMDVCLL